MHDSQRVPVTHNALGDIVLMDGKGLASSHAGSDSDAAAPGAQATVVNSTVFYAASGCAVAAVVVVIVVIVIFCRCSSRDKKRRHGNLIRRDNSVFR